MRHARNIFALAVITAAIIAAYLFYVPSRSDILIDGVTVSEKLQSVARIVSKQHTGVVSVVYVSSHPEVHEFIVALTYTPRDITTQEKSIEVSRSYRDALVTILRLTAVEVLPIEPSIKMVVINTVDVYGIPKSYYALAQDLRVLSVDAPDEVWLAKLQPVPDSTKQ